MKKLLILLSIFFLLGNSNINSAGRSDEAAAEAPANKKQRIESKEEKEKTEVGRSPNFNVKDDKVMKEIASAYLHIPRGISGLILDYCKTKFDPAYKFSAHACLINSLVILDETHFASGSPEGEIKIWQYIRSTADAPEKYECIQVLDRSNQGHTDFVNSLIKYDDTHFISGSKDQTIKIWEFISATDSTQATCRWIQTLDLRNDGHRVSSLVKLDDNHFASSSRNGIIKIWELIPGKAPKNIYTLNLSNDSHRDIVNSLMKLDDNHFISGSWDSSIKIWELIPGKTYQCIHTLNERNDGHTDWVNALIRLDDNHFVSGSEDNTIKIWEFFPATGSTPVQCRFIQTLDRANGGHRKPVNSLIKLDENRFASGSTDRTIKIWEFIPATSSTPATCVCIQTLSINCIPVSLTRMFNGDLIAGLFNGSIQVIKPVVDIE